MDESKLIELINDKKIVDILESKNHLALAKLLGKEFCGFTEDDEKYVDLFWNTAFNKGWLYLSDEIIIDWMGYSGKDAIRNFHRDIKKNIELKLTIKKLIKNVKLWYITGIKIPQKKIIAVVL